ncbi:hypothetical protein BURK2_02282 [Burkholderiales bacterium]|nr:MAG: hypothetical protein F9K47_01110 [Burkholderiales bacterium]CAG0989150.1 hypothetical protein BURK2_02282 [Burkholderiales bacterium]
MTQGTANPSSGAPEFFDSKGCRKWLVALPLTNHHRAAEMLMGQFTALADVPLDGVERARIAETLREPVYYLHGELTKRFAQKPIPFSASELGNFTIARDLWQALWGQFSLCIKPLLEGEPNIQAYAPNILQRGLYVAKQLAVVYGLARQHPPKDYWLELHAYFRFAEMLQCADNVVKDKLIPGAGSVSCYSTYSHALLLAAADPFGMSARQLEYTDRWLERWARKLRPVAQEPPAGEVVFMVDLKAAHGLTQPIPGGASDPEAVRYATIEKLEASIDKRIKRLKGGALPGELGLGADCAVETALVLLEHLHRHWCTYRGRGVAGLAEVPLAVCGGGLAGAYFRVAGQTFATVDVHGRASYRSAQQLATFTVVTGYDREREQADRAWPWTPWRGNIGPEGCVLHAKPLPEVTWQLDQLAVWRDERGHRSPGWLKRLGVNEKGEIEIVVMGWPGEPKALDLVPVGSLLKQESNLPALLLPKTGQEPMSLILPTRVFNPGRRLQTRSSGTVQVYRLVRSLQRGVDFERVVCEVE